MHLKRILVFTCLALLTSVLAFAQGVYNNGATLTITSGTVFTIDGGTNAKYTNNSDGSSHGSIDIDGTLLLEGDWTNNATSGNVFINRDGDGVTEFSSSNAQAIAGTAATVFEDLKINNSLGGAAVTLSVDAEVSDDLELTDGIVQTGTNYLIHSATAAAKLVDYSATEFINGNYRRHFASNTDTYVFPVGDGTTSSDYKRMDFINGSLDLSGGTDFLNVSVTTVTEDGGTMNDATFLAATVSCLGTTLQQVHSGAVWTVDPSNATISSGDYGMNLYVGNAGDGLTSSAKDNMFTVVQSSDISDYGNWVSAACAEGVSIPSDNLAGRIWNSGAGYAQKTTFSTVTSPTKFAIASANVILPIELLSFDVRCENGSAKLIWETLSEQDVSHYEVLKSKDNTEFYKIGTVESLHNTNQLQTYTFMDAEGSGDAYYKVQEVDFGGARSFFPDVIYTSSCGKNSAGNYEVYYNQNSKVIININAEQTEDYVIDLRDITGKLVTTFNTNGQIGWNGFEMNVPQIATGTYLVNVIGSKNTLITQKLFVQ